MSTDFVIYREATEWFGKGKVVEKLLSDAQNELNSKETQWNIERKELKDKIGELNRSIKENYGCTHSIKRNRNVISSYERRVRTEEAMMKKVEYAEKCLDFIRIQMILDAGRIAEFNRMSASPGVIYEIALKESDVDDDLSKNIEKLAEFLEGSEEDEIISYTKGEDGVDVPVYAPDVALYDGGHGKFIKLEPVDGCSEDTSKIGPVEHNFPSIFQLKRSGFDLDSIIGLAHTQFIGGIRDDGEISFEYVDPIKDWDTGKCRPGYYGVSEIPAYFRKNQSESAERWLSTITLDNPVKMYVGDHSQCQYISSMEDILKDGRLYENRFGIKYNSSPEKVNWELDN